MKKLFAVVMMIFFMVFVGSAFAYEAPETGYYVNNGGNVHWYEQGQNVPKAYEFLNAGGGQGGQGGAGGSANQSQNNYNSNFNAPYNVNAPTNYNSNGQSQGIYGSGNSYNENKNTNLNTNLNTNKNDNTNVNINGGNKQGQMQGQLQGQAQGQMQGQAAIAVQGQTAHNSGVNQTVIMEDKRELISPPPVAIPDAKLSREKAGDILCTGSLWGSVTKITADEVDSVLKCGLLGCDFDIKVRALSSGEATTEIALGTEAKGKFLGTIYVLSEGEDMVACEAAAAREAMKIGGTLLVKTGSSSKVASVGSSYGVGLGGGASMFGHDDTIAIAPAGGFGFGKANASNERLPQAVFSVYGK